MAESFLQNSIGINEMLCWSQTHLEASLTITQQDLHGTLNIRLTILRVFPSCCLDASNIVEPHAWFLHSVHLSRIHAVNPSWTRAVICFEVTTSDGIGNLPTWQLWKISGKFREIFHRLRNLGNHERWESCWKSSGILGIFISQAVIC